MPNAMSLSARLRTPSVAAASAPTNLEIQHFIINAALKIKWTASNIRKTQRSGDTTSETGNESGKLCHIHWILEDCCLQIKAPNVRA